MTYPVVTINFRWSFMKGEASMKISEAFKSEDYTTQLDMLQDCLYDLENLYNETLNKAYKK